MRCPYCGNEEDKVIDSRLAEGGLSTRRRRECRGCGERFTTFERYEETRIMVVKRSGLLEPFQREKVVAGLKKAFEKRGVSPELVEEITDQLEEHLRTNYPREVPSREIGRWILGRLREVDGVAYLRFASVYKGFQDLQEFGREIGDLLEKSSPPKQAKRVEEVEWDR